MADEQPKAVPIRELAQRAREHYEELSTLASDWSSVIPQAIDAWERERTRLAGEPRDWRVRLETLEAKVARIENGVSEQLNEIYRAGYRLGKRAPTEPAPSVRDEQEAHSGVWLVSNDALVEWLRATATYNRKWALDASDARLLNLVADRLSAQQSPSPVQQEPVAWISRDSLKRLESGRSYGSEMYGRDELRDLPSGYSSLVALYAGASPSVQEEKSEQAEGWWLFIDRDGDPADRVCGGDRAYAEDAMADYERQWPKGAPYRLVRCAPVPASAVPREQEEQEQLDEERAEAWERFVHAPEGATVLNPQIKHGGDTPADYELRARAAISFDAGWWAAACLLRSPVSPQEEQEQPGAVLWDVRKIEGAVSAVDMSVGLRESDYPYGWITVRVPRGKCSGLRIGATANLTICMPPVSPSAAPDAGEQP